MAREGRYAEAIEVYERAVRAVRGAGLGADPIFRGANRANELSVHTPPDDVVCRELWHPLRQGRKLRPLLLEARLLPLRL